MREDFSLQHSSRLTLFSFVLLGFKMAWSVGLPVGDGHSRDGEELLLGYKGEGMATWDA